MFFVGAVVKSSGRGGTTTWEAISEAGITSVWHEVSYRASVIAQSSEPKRARHCTSGCYRYCSGFYRRGGRAASAASCEAAEPRWNMLDIANNQTSDHRHDRNRECEDKQPGFNHAAPLPKELRCG